MAIFSSPRRARPLRLLLTAAAATTATAAEFRRNPHKIPDGPNPHDDPDDLQNRPAKDRIVGGNRAERGRYPFTVPIVDSFGQFCGGSLIADNAVLTAAHCLPPNTRLDGVQVRVGSDLSSQGTAYDIEKGIMHPEYGDETDSFDIYVIILKERVTDVDPVAVNSDGAWPVSGMQARSMGWGLTEENGRGSAVLLEVDLDVISNKECKAAGQDYNDWIFDDMICTSTPGKDACQGDSGGPLIIPDDKSDEHDDVLFGVVSWGVGCARMPGVFSRTSASYDWIVKNVCVDNGGNGPICQSAKGAPPPPEDKPIPVEPASAGSDEESAPEPKPTAPRVVAAYDDNYKVPKCSAVGSSCSSGDLLKGTGANVEPNAPNTLDECEDPGRGEYQEDESIEAIKVSALGSSGRLEKGSMAEIQATVYAYKDGAGDAADFFYTKRANKPEWKYIGTAKPEGGGRQKLKVQYEIPFGAKFQAVRVNFRNSGREAFCSTGRFDERDDLVFAVEGVKEEEDDGEEEVLSRQSFRGFQPNTDGDLPTTS